MTGKDIIIKFLIENSDNREISKCPAVILADRRTDNVIGRIKFLTSSISAMKFIREIGVPVGVRCAKKFFELLIMFHNIKDNQKVIAKKKETVRWAEGVKLYWNSDKKFIKKIITNKFFIVEIEYGFLFLMVCEISFSRIFCAIIWKKFILVDNFIRLLGINTTGITIISHAHDI